MTVIGVCSWSLKPRSPEDLAARVGQAGLSAVQLALEPLRDGRWDVDRTVGVLRDAGIAIRSGMMSTRGEDYSSIEAIRRTGGLRPSEHWWANQQAAGEIARLARRLSLPLVSFHAGFLPDDPRDPEHAVMLHRLRTLADRFAAEGVTLALETGQESAETLAAFLEALQRGNVGVNFDPANMLLYGAGEPIAALRRLAPSVRQCHVKDALPSDKPGVEWGREVPVGQGAVDWPAFVAVLREHGKLGIDLMIEREAGDERLADIAAARALLQPLL